MDCGQRRSRLMRAMSSVDLAGGGEFLLALCEFFFRLGQGVVELFDAGIGRVGDGGVAEVCEYLAAEDLAEAAA